MKTFRFLDKQLVLNFAFYLLYSSLVVRPSWLDNVYTFASCFAIFFFHKNIVGETDAHSHLQKEKREPAKFDISKVCFFSIWVFFHEHSRFTGNQGKEEGISLTPFYHFHPLHRHLDISRVITAENSPLHTVEPLVSERKSLTTKLRSLNSQVTLVISRHRKNH